MGNFAAAYLYNLPPLGRTCCLRTSPWIWSWDPPHPSLRFFFFFFVLLPVAQAFSCLLPLRPQPSEFFRIFCSIGPTALCLPLEPEKCNCWVPVRSGAQRLRTDKRGKNSSTGPLEHWSTGTLRLGSGRGLAWGCLLAPQISWGRKLATEQTGPQLHRFCQLRCSFQEVPIRFFVIPSFGIRLTCRRWVCAVSFSPLTSDPFCFYCTLRFRSLSLSASLHMASGCFFFRFLPFSLSSAHADLRL